MRVGVKVDPDDLVGAAEVQAILKLSHPSSVTTYLRISPGIRLGRFPEQSTKADCRYRTFTATRWRCEAHARQVTPSAQDVLLKAIRYALPGIRI